MEAVRGNRGSRPPSDISLITGFIKSYLPQVAGVLSESDLHDLSNEIDWVTASNNSIIFLQNELADSYYLIGKGSVNFYYEADDCVSHALQMSFRPASCSQLGSYLGQVIRGHGFGEYALLAKSLSKSAANQPQRRHKDNPRSVKPPHTHKSKKSEESHQTAGRSCTAVCGADDTLLFVVHEATYFRIFKKFHHAQRQLAHCIHFMQKLPFFRHASLAKVTQVAFRTTKTKLPFKAVLGESGFNIECVSVVMSGVVRVGARPDATSSSLVLLDDAFILESPSVTSVETGISNFTSITNITSMTGLTGIKGNGSVTSNTTAPPLPSIATLKAGQTVGDIEVRKGLNTYKFHYDVQSLSVELLQIPHEVYLECARDAAFNDPNCANLTVLSETERARRSAERLRKLRVVHGCNVSPSLADLSISASEIESAPMETANDTPRTESSPVYADATAEEGSAKKVSFQEEEEKGICAAAPQTIPHSAPHTMTQKVPPKAPHKGPQTAPHAHTQHVPLLNLSATTPPLFSPMASPPRTARPSKTSYRAQRSTSLGGSTGGSSNTNSNSKTSTKNPPSSARSPRTGGSMLTERSVFSELTDRSTTSIPGAVFSPAPPMGLSPRAARANISTTHPSTNSSTKPTNPSINSSATSSTTQTHLGGGYADIADPIDPLEGRYPEASRGPNVCSSYASSAAEAALAVAREMRAIRARVRIKQKSLAAEEIRLDPAGL